MHPHLEERRLGAARILFGENRGKYPDANCVLVEGTEERALLDTTPGLVERGRDAVAPVDRILLTHCHEDHMAGNFLFPEARVALHEEDHPGILSLEAMLGIYGYPEPRRSHFARLLVERFHFEPRPAAEAFTEGDCFDLGGGVRVEVIHTPGHTRGHCVFRIEPAGILFLGDIDLSSFGPYYGDAWSNLEAFEASLRKVRPLAARHYLSSHHVGLVDRPAFLERLDRYAAKIREREERLVEFLRAPHTLEEIAQHRFVYRPQDDVAHAAWVEKVMMGQHLERLIAQGRVEEAEAGLYRVVSRGGSRES